MTRKSVSPEQAQLGASLEELIASHSREIALRMVEIANWAKSEEDVRYECNKLIDGFIDHAGLTIRGRHEYGLAGGRIDSKYAGVIIEYKSPTGAGKITEDASSAGNRAVEKQLTGRFRDFKDLEPNSSARIFGVGTDGDTFVFARERNGKVEVERPLPVTAYSVERLLRALVSLGAHGKSFTPENLSADFGSDSEPGAKGVRELCEAICGELSPKATTLFSEWKILFSEVCGYDIDTRSEKIEALSEHYGVPGDVSPAQLLFSLQSYYAIFMKFLAAELTTSFSPLGTSLIRACVSAPTSTDLKSEMTKLERGGTWADAGIVNFLEGDLFSWYVECWNDGIAEVVRSIASALDKYDPATLSVDPSESRDLLKKLYHELFPRSVRHGLGEYYTPDWLAEHTLNLVKYDGNPDKRITDPACGSGTFLVMAINRIRQWYDAFGETPPFGRKQLLDRILKNVVGFDLNPLAVMAARTNVLLALRDLITAEDHVALPVFLCDSIQPPTENAGLAASRLGKAVDINTAVGRLTIPTETAESHASLERYTEILSDAVSGGYEFEDFQTRCATSGVPFTDVGLHRSLFEHLAALHEEGRDGIWARIIKNSFAPLFTKPADYVVGNPPWIFWNNLPPTYRDQARALMTDRYGIMSSGASTMKQLGAAGKDLSMLFVYVSMDRYLKTNGRLGFVITQSIFQSTAGNEFRRFKLPRRGAIRVDAVEDWVQVEPFRPKAGNKTALLIATKGPQTTYPLPYRVWRSDDRFDRESASLSAVLGSCRCADRWASPSGPRDRNSFWRISDSVTEATREGKERASFDYQARLGVETKLESAFRVNMIAPAPNGTVVVENDRARARIPLPQVSGAVDAALLAPYLTGETVHRWFAEPAGVYIVPHTRETGMAPIPEATMRTKFPSTYAFLSQFKSELEGRSLHQRWGKGNPFYSMYNIGPYTFAPYKVVWKRTTKNFSAAVVNSMSLPGVGTRLLIPNGKVMMVPFEEEGPAQFLAAQINNSVARLRINDSITSEAHKGIINVVPLREFDASNDLHQAVATAAAQASIAAEDQAALDLPEVELEVDRLVAELWNIPYADFELARTSLPTSKSRKRKNLFASPGGKKTF